MMFFGGNELVTHCPAKLYFVRAIYFLGKGELVRLFQEKP